MLASPIKFDCQRKSDNAASALGADAASRQS